MENCVIAKTVKIGKNVKIGAFSVIMDKAEIGSGSRLGNGVIVYPEVVIGKNAWLEDHVVLGRQPKGSKNTAIKISKKEPPLKIGINVVIGAGAVLYAGCIIGNNVYIADGCIIRERNTIDDQVRLGKGVIFEHDAHLRKGVIVQANGVIGEFMDIGEGAFIGNTFSANCDKLMKMHANRFNPPKIKRGVRIGGNVTLVPGVTIGEYAVVGAGAVVTKDVAPKTVVVGNPARFLKNVED